MIYPAVITRTMHTDFKFGIRVYLEHIDCVNTILYYDGLIFSNNINKHILSKQNL